MYYKDAQILFLCGVVVGVTLGIALTSLYMGVRP